MTLLTAKEAAKKYDVPLHTIYARMRSGRLQAEKKDGVMKFKASDVKAALPPQPGKKSGVVVKGYVRKDGREVPPHTRKKRSCFKKPEAKPVAPQTETPQPDRLDRIERLLRYAIKRMDDIEASVHSPRVSEAQARQELHNASHATEEHQKNGGGLMARIFS